MWYFHAVHISIILLCSKIHKNMLVPKITRFIPRRMNYNMKSKANILDELVQNYPSNKSRKIIRFFQNYPKSFYISIIIVLLEDQE